jgi:hypothetical protein
MLSSSKKRHPAFSNSLLILIRAFASFGIMFIPLITRYIVSLISKEKSRQKGNVYRNQLFQNLLFKMHLQLHFVDLFQIYMIR